MVETSINPWTKSDFVVKNEDDRCDSSSSNVKSGQETKITPVPCYCNM